MKRNNMCPFCFIKSLFQKEKAHKRKSATARLRKRRCAHSPYGLV